MNRILGLLTLGAFGFSALLSSVAHADPQTSVVLYQIGSKGKYCLSLTKDEGGCVSGMDAGGQALNLVDVTRGKKVRFENLSDAPHDMRITGQNAEDLPAQGPNAAPVLKQMNKEDRDKQSITCSFHGNQLGLGYRVLDDSGTSKQRASEHRDRRADLPAGSDANEGELQGPRPMVRTGLADVSREVLTKGRPEDVEKLIASRPELIEDLKKIRPLLAEEVAEKLGASPDRKDGKAGLAGNKDGDALLADGEEDEEEPTAGKAGMSLEGLMALAAGTAGEGAAQGGAGAGVRGANGRETASGSGTTFDDDAVDATGRISAKVIPGSEGRKIGAPYQSALAPSKRLLASVDGFADLATGRRAFGPQEMLNSFTSDKGRLMRLLGLLAVIAITLRGLFLLLFSKRRTSKEKA